MTEENKEPTIEERLRFVEKQNMDLLIMLLTIAETVHVLTDVLDRLKDQVKGTTKYGGPLN